MRHAALSSQVTDKTRTLDDRPPGTKPGASAHGQCPPLGLVILRRHTTTVASAHRQCSALRLSIHRRPPDVPPRRPASPCHFHLVQSYRQRRLPGTKLSTATAAPGTAKAPAPSATTTTTWPGQSSGPVRKYLPKSIANAKGPLDQHRANIQSTQPQHNDSIVRTKSIAPQDKTAEDLQSTLTTPPGIRLECSHCSSPYRSN
jgi:hypothetical protein